MITSFKYNPGRQTLQVIFVSGSVYDYKNVPEDVYRQMVAAASKGAFLNREVKTRFRFKKIK
ncbi:KTSC domain-containing protein [Mucilaginibacter gotjawali]|uniref:KTSC domain-containing protein n=1 Tax=Mucilaginibacter gotjawali TaxID=1550579 RepID=UPI0018D599E0|nr:KTSC domain-containing protein [Mucilaginibacter gotjawali]